MSKALYRKYRSKTLDELVGQKHITELLKKAINNGNISHAYLFTGPRGVGKTSVARILAHAINNIEYQEDATNLDIIEIDAASNNSVEDVRNLRERINIAPVSLRHKVYIIDEVHMLSKSAFNALLKTLEEPPKHIVFILATTNIEKLPPTIISRTQRYAFRPITSKDLEDHLAYIAKSEKIDISKDAIALIAEHGDGSFRDSISLLDQMSNLAGKDTEITVEMVLENLGLASRTTVIKLTDAILNRDSRLIIDTLDELTNQGINTVILASQIVKLIIEDIDKYKSLIPLSSELIELGKSQLPNIKLLTILLNFSLKKPIKSIPLIATKHEVSAKVDDLLTLPKKNPEITNSSKKITNKKKKTGIVTNTVDPSSLLEYTKQHHIALYSVLAKCGFDTIDDTLVIYTGSSFYKKKLDDPKYSQLIAQSLVDIGCPDIEIETIADKLPIKDSQVATIADIMGGGEEFSLEAA